MIQFHPDYSKTVEVVLWVLNNSPGIHLYNLMKVLFHADVVSVNRYGRPVIGDTYLAMEHGTVPQLVYTELMRRESWLLDALGWQNWPWSSEGHAWYAHRPANADYLSQTDQIALLEGIQEYASLPFAAVRAKNHRVKAWISTWQHNPGGVMDWADLIEDEGVRADFEDLAPFLVFA